MKFLSGLLPTFWFLKPIAIVTCVGDHVANLFANFEVFIIVAVKSPASS